MNGSPQPAAPSMPAVTDAFELPRTIVGVRSVDQAWSNRVFKLDTDGGSYAVKQLLNPWREPRWLDWLAEAAAFELHAYRAGIAMPEPVTDSGGAVFAEIPDDTGTATVTVRVHSWVSGTPCPPGPVLPAPAQQIGIDLATMHGLDHRPRRTDVFPTVTDAQIAAWPALVDRLRAPAAELARAADAVTPVVRSIGQLLADADTDMAAAPMSHGDVDQKNLIITPSGPVLCDWDVAAPWIPRQELARTALSMATWQDPAVARAVIDGYAATSGVRYRLQPEDLAADLVIGLDWLALCLERAAGLRDDGEQRRREAVQAAPGLLAGLATQLERVLGVRTWLAG